MIYSRRRISGDGVEAGTRRAFLTGKQKGRQI
jgi:hypothetical protein